MTTKEEIDKLNLEYEGRTFPEPEVGEEVLIWCWSGYAYQDLNNDYYYYSLREKIRDDLFLVNQIDRNDDYLVSVFSVQAVKRKEDITERDKIVGSRSYIKNFKN